MVYASAAEKTVMFGGATDEGSSLNDTWMYDRGKNTWTPWIEPLGGSPRAVP